MITCQASGGKCKETDLFLRSSKEDINTRCVDEYTVSFASVKALHLSAQKSLTVVKTKTEFDSHADT